MTILHDLEEIAAALGGHWRQSPIIEDEKVDAGKAPEQPFVAAVTAGKRQGVKQPRQALIEDGTVVAARLVAERASDPALADPGRSDDEKVMMAGDPLAGGELVEQRLVEPARRPEIDILDDGVLAQAREAQTADEPFVLALTGLIGDPRFDFIAVRREGTE